MPSNFGSNDSKWSSERERQERERQRDAQKELLRQARLEREAKEAREAAERLEAGRSSAAAAESAVTSAGTTVRRHLSDADAAVARRLRGESDPLPPADTPAAPDTTASSGSSGRGSGIGRRWRSQVEEFARGGSGGNGGGGGLPDLPGDTGGRRPNRNRNFLSARVLTFGIILFLLMASFAFLPFGPFNNSGSNPTPTTYVLGDLPTLAPNGTAVSSLPQPTANPNSKGIVCVDPGHGGWDTGFVRPLDQQTAEAPAQQESEINLGMGLMLRDRLQSMGYTVVMTRTTGESPNPYGKDVNGDGKTILDGDSDTQKKQNATYDDIQARINICDQAHADVLISVHINGYSDSNPDVVQQVSGYEVIYTPGRQENNISYNSELLANVVYRRLSQSMDSANYQGQARGVKMDTEDDVQKYADGTAAQDHFLMTGPIVDSGGRIINPPSEMPGITCEPVFISNDYDAQFIADPAHQQLIVDAYAQGVDDFFKSPDRKK